MKTIDPIACLILTRKHKPNYFSDLKLKKNTGLPTGKTYTAKEYYDFKNIQNKKKNDG